MSFNAALLEERIRDARARSPVSEAQTGTEATEKNCPMQTRLLIASQSQAKIDRSEKSEVVKSLRLKRVRAPTDGCEYCCDFMLAP